MRSSLASGLPTVPCRIRRSYRAGNDSAWRSRAGVPNDARLVLADEPTGALHSDDKAGVIALLTRAAREGKTVVIVTHDDAIAAICDRRLEIRDGHVTEVPPRGPGAGRAA